MPRDVGRPRGAEARVSVCVFLEFCRLTSPEMRLVCAVGPMIKSSACSCQDA